MAIINDHTITSSNWNSFGPNNLESAELLINGVPILSRPQTIDVANDLLKDEYFRLYDVLNQEDSLNYLYITPEQFKSTFFFMSFNLMEDLYDSDSHWNRYNEGCLSLNLKFSSKREKIIRLVFYLEY